MLRWPRKHSPSATLESLPPSAPALQTLHTLPRAGATRVHSGEVLAWCGERRRHQVLYDDGEDEWLDLAAERLVWHAPRGGRAVAAGLPEGAPRRARPAPCRVCGSVRSGGCCLIRT